MTFKEWDGKPLTGRWLFTIKIDGVQGSFHDGAIVTKGGFAMSHIPQNVIDSVEKSHKWNGNAQDKMEVFCGSWNETMSIVRAFKSKRRDVRIDEIYPLFPNIDKRLDLGSYDNPTAEEIRNQFNKVVKAGYEGLVLRQGDVFIKVKTVYTKDVKITGFVEGKGKFAGMLGKVTTDEGDCGTGYTNDQRKEIWANRKKLLGKFVEIKSMETTKNGKLRNPRFVRLRLDK